MHFDVNAQPTEVPALLSQFIGITGIEAWTQKEAVFSRQIKDNPILEGYIDSHFSLERSLLYVRRYKQDTGRIPPVNSAHLGALYAFVAMTARVFRRLPDGAKKTLRDTLIGALKGDIGLAPLAFEMRTAAHFVALGGDVEFHDICEKGGYDLLVKHRGVEVEVECKSVSSDLGRPIHLLRQHQLGRFIFPQMKEYRESGYIKFLVATLPDRLHGQREFMEAISARIVEALIEGKDVDAGTPSSVSYHRFAIAGSPFDCTSPLQINEQEIINYCHKKTGEEVGHIIIMFGPRNYAMVVGLKSLRPNQPLKAIYRNLRDAASLQLSATRPGIICVQFRNMTDAELRELAEAPAQSGQPSGIQLMTSKLLDTKSRNHVHTISYTAPGNFIQRQSLSRDVLTADFIRTTEISEDAASYTFINRRNSGADDVRYRFFER